MPLPAGARPDARSLARAVAATVAIVLLVPWSARAGGAASRGKRAPDLASRELETRAAQLYRERSSPRALVDLIELGELEPELPDLGPLAAVYARFADDVAAEAETRAYARFRLAYVQRSRGDLAGANAEIDKLAFLGTWQIAGPFENEGRRGFDEVFPAERDQDLGAKFPGKAREVGWRTLPPEAFSLGFVHVGAAIRPARDVAVYALTVLDSPATQRVQLHLGTSGAAKVFVDGDLVYADPGYHPARFDQAAVAFTLHPGANRILVKLCHSEGRLGFYARLADVQGRPLPVAASPLPPLPALHPPLPRHAEPVPGLLAALERRVERASHAEAAAAHYDLAFALAERRPGDDRERRALREARRAAELAPGSVTASLLAARLEEDPNHRRRHLERALAAHPADVRVLVPLAQHALQRGRLLDARRYLERALASDPSSISARLALADVWEQAGLAYRARAGRLAMARSHPSHPAALVAAARSERLADHLDEAAQLLRAALALRYDDAVSRATLVQLLVDRADVAGAVRLLDESIRLSPGDVEARLRLGDLLAANGRRDEAELAFGDALRIVPDEADIYERRGQARLRAGRTEDALRDFASSLDIRPQNPQLKELVRAIAPARERFERDYLYDARELARTAPAPRPDDDSVVLGDLKLTRVFPSGLSSSVTQLVVKVRTQRGVDQWRSWSTSYSPDRQEVRVDRARIVKADGSVVDGFQERDRSASEPWYRLYYDTRTRQVTFPALAPGDLLEIVVRTDDVARENLLADYFGEMVFLADSTRKLRTDYVLLVPEGRRIFANEPRLANLAHTERTVAGGLVEHRWTARDVPAIQAEPGMPGWSEVAPYVHVSTYRSWDEVARFYWSLVRDQLVPTSEIAEVALRIQGEVRAARRARDEPPSGDELAVVQAVHRFVVTNTRYVGLEFGIHGYKPYSVDQILERRFGDCKDKASLTHALLEALGIDSRLVLLRMRHLGRVGDQPASLAVFNHAILYVPRHDLWLDGTASYSGSRDLPIEDRGATVLVVNPGEAPRFGTIPEGLPEQNTSDTDYRVVLRADGSAAVEGQARVSGVQAPSWRRAYAAEHDRRAQLEEAMSRTFPGSTVQDVAASDLTQLEDGVMLRFVLAVPSFADRDGEQLRFLPFGAAQRYAETLAPLSSRHHDLVIGPPSETRLRYRYVVPAGFAVAAVPDPVHVVSSFGRFDVSYRREDGGLIAEARLVMKASRVEATDYGAFREFVAQVDGALAQPIRLRPAAAARPAAERERG